jgi:hypothetical protein
MATTDQDYDHKGFQDPQWYTGASTMHSDWTTTTGGFPWPQAVQTLQTAIPTPFRAFTFMRVNQEVHEGMQKEPLDELRIKVAKWLRRNE